MVVVVVDAVGDGVLAVALRCSLCHLAVPIFIENGRLELRIAFVANIALDVQQKVPLRMPLAPSVRMQHHCPLCALHHLQPMFSEKCSLPLSHNRSHLHQFQRGSLRPQAGVVAADRVSCAFQQSTRLGSFACDVLLPSIDGVRSWSWQIVSAGSLAFLFAYQRKTALRSKGMPPSTTMVCIRACLSHTSARRHA